MKLGLIAMSATRAHNKELTELGFTLPGFVDRSRVIASLPSLGLLTLAGMTPAAVELEYVDVPDLSQVDGLPGEFDAVAISSFTAQINEAYKLADRLVFSRLRQIFGGRVTQFVTGAAHISAWAAKHNGDILRVEGVRF